MDAPFDLRPVFREHWPSYGPDWDRAIDMGIDVSLIEYNLSLTPEQRILRLHHAQQMVELLRSAMERAEHT
jgi:hypothetical protein